MERFERIHGGYGIEKRNAKGRMLKDGNFEKN